MNFEKQVDELFAPWHRPDSPGCAVGVFKDGEIVYAAGYGMASVELGVPNTPRTVFEIESTSKQFAAACMALLHLTGALSLDRDVRDIVPELKALPEITVRQLVHHTSGIRDVWALMDVASIPRDHLRTDAQVLELLSRQRTLNFPPGSAFLYSNSNYVLMSIIVERVSGMSMRQFAQERIFGPLGMDRTLFRDDATMLVPHRAVGHSLNPAGGWRVEEYWPDTCGDGGLHTTVEDLHRWDNNFYENRLEHGFNEQMLERGVAGDKRIAYAFGLTYGRYRGLRTISHAGGWTGFRAELMRFPEQHFSVVCLANAGAGAMWPTAMTYRIADLFLGDAATAPRPTVTPPAATGVLAPGTYRSPSGAMRLHLDESGEGWSARLLAQRIALTPQGDTLRSAAGDVVLIVTPLDNAVDLTIDAAHGAIHELIFLEVGTWSRVDPPSSEEADVAAHAGTYRSTELDATVRVAAAEDGLVFVGADGKPKPLEAMGPDAYTDGQFFVLFVDTGLELTATRANATLFERVA